MDKPTINSLTNQGSLTATLGGFFYLVGDPLSRGITPRTMQLIGYGLILAGLLMNAIGSRRATGKLITKVGELNSKLEDNRIAISKLSNCNNGHDLDEGPIDLGKEG